MKLHFRLFVGFALAAAALGSAPAVVRAEAAIAAQQELLREAAAQPGLAAFYGTREGAPLWTVAGGPLSPAPLLAALDAAAGHALPAAAYGAPGLRARVERGNARDAAALDVALSRALARYADDLASGVLVPNRADREINVFPVRLEPFQALVAAARAPDLGAWLAGLAPATAEYDALRRLYAELSAKALAGGWRAALGDGGALRSGDAGPRVAQLRTRLAELGDPAAPAVDPERFDDALADAVKAFQRRHGLNADGIVGARTFAALGADAGERLRQVAVNLERLRWGPDDYGPRYIRVNLADYRMHLVEDGREVHSARVVVGQRRFRTPEFSDVMDHMVINPTWHVPRSIVTQEILPLLQEDPTYLARQNMRLVSSDTAVPETPEAHDWSQYTRASFPYRVRQSPGPGNALGTVKFMFPNKFNIYLHDTPSKSLFARDARAFSHGCVRVQDPHRLAHLLLAPQEADPEAAFNAWLATERERYVTLARPVPVHLTYRTAWLDADGKPQFRDDVYGRDARIWAALEAAGLTPGL